MVCVSPLTSHVMMYVVWWSWFCLPSRHKNAFYCCPSNQSKVQQAALHLKNCSTLSGNICGASDFFNLLTHSKPRTSSLRSEWDCSPNELVQHINLLVLLNACSVTRACNGTKIPGALLALNSLKESFKFLSACLSLTSFIKNLEFCISERLCILGLGKLVRAFPGSINCLGAWLCSRFYCIADYMSLLLVPLSRCQWICLLHGFMHTIYVEKIFAFAVR